MATSYCDLNGNFFVTEVVTPDSTKPRTKVLSSFFSGLDGVEHDVTFSSYFGNTDDVPAEDEVIAVTSSQFANSGGTADARVKAETLLRFNDQLGDPAADDYLQRAPHLEPVMLRVMGIVSRVDRDANAYHIRGESWITGPAPFEIRVVVPDDPRFRRGLPTLNAVVAARGFVVGRLSSTSGVFVIQQEHVATPGIGSIAGVASPGKRDSTSAKEKVANAKKRTKDPIAASSAAHDLGENTSGSANSAGGPVEAIVADEELDAETEGGEQPRKRAKGKGKGRAEK